MLTLDGMVELRLPSGVQHDTMLVMRGRGVRELQGSRRGNQIVHVKVEVPKGMTSRCVHLGWLLSCFVLSDWYGYEMYVCIHVYIDDGLISSITLTFIYHQQTQTGNGS